MQDGPGTVSLVDWGQDEHSINLEQENVSKNIPLLSTKLLDRVLVLVVVMMFCLLSISPSFMDAQILHFEQKILWKKGAMNVR